MSSMDSARLGLRHTPTKPLSYVSEAVHIQRSPCQCLPSCTLTMMMSTELVQQPRAVPTGRAAAVRMDGGRHGAMYHSATVAPSRNPSWWPNLKLFRGLHDDLCRRAPWYASDWRDAWDYRVIPATGQHGL